MLNYTKLRFSIDFVDSNVINLNVDGVAISPVTYADSHSNTIGLLIDAINNTGLARASLDVDDFVGRTVYIQGLRDSLIVVDSVTVTGGVAQPTSFIETSIYSDLLEQAVLLTGSVFDTCGKTDLVRALMIMHWLTLIANSGTGNAQSGFVKSKQEGKISISYGSSVSKNYSNTYSLSDAEWTQTAYGMRYLAIKAMCFIGVRNRMINESLY